MGNRTANIALAFGVTLALCSCAGYNKLLKSQDHDLKYSTAIDYYNKEKYDKALALFDSVAPYINGSLRQDTLDYYTACCYYRQGDFSTSGELFDTFRRRFGHSPYLEDVEYMYAMGYYFSSPEPQWDQTSTHLAISAINEYLAHYPQSVKLDTCHDRLEELQGKLYEKSFINARTYYKIGNYKSAMVAIGNALSLYPDTPYREELMYLNTSSCHKLAENSIPSLQTDRYLTLMDLYYDFVSAYPESDHRREVERMQQDAKRYLAKINLSGDEAEGKSDQEKQN